MLCFLFLFWPICVENWEVVNFRKRPRYLKVVVFYLRLTIYKGFYWGRVDIGTSYYLSFLLKSPVLVLLFWWLYRDPKTLRKDSPINFTWRSTKNLRGKTCPLKWRQWYKVEILIYHLYKSPLSYENTDITRCVPRWISETTIVNRDFNDLEFVFDLFWQITPPLNFSYVKGMWHVHLILCTYVELICFPTSVRLW